MKETAESLVKFSRTEKRGLILLCTLVMGLLIIRASMHLWVHPVMDDARQQQLAKAWKDFEDADNDSLKAANEEDSAANAGQEDDAYNKGRKTGKIQLHTKDNPADVEIRVRQ